MKKPDRFEREAKKIQLTGPSGNYYKQPYIYHDIAKLLRKEHRWVEQMIRRHAKSIYGLRAGLHPDFVSGHLQASEEFLNMLKKRRK